MNRADGQTMLTATVPDTITSWVLSAFAINADVGLGVASERAKVNYHYKMDELCVCVSVLSLWPLL